MEEEVLARAKELIESPDFIIDMYDHTIVWAQDDIYEKMKVSNREGILSIDDIFDKNMSPYSDLGTEGKDQKGTFTIEPFHKEFGKLKMRIQYANFMIDKEFYRVGKILEMTELVD